jgi:hypothetical protein
MPDAPVVVSLDNFARAESDLYFGNIAKDDGFGTFFFLRELTPIDHQLVIRANRDRTASSSARTSTAVSTYRTGTGQPEDRS